jgi:glucose-6-phosphate 1-dehydrogenase
MAQSQLQEPASTATPTADAAMSQALVALQRVADAIERLAANQAPERSVTVAPTPGARPSDATNTWGTALLSTARKQQRSFSSLLSLGRGRSHKQQIDAAADGEEAGKEGPGRQSRRLSGSSPRPSRRLPGSSPAPTAERPPPVQHAVAELTDRATLHSMPLSIVIFGATGDLARKKLFPALYQLCALGHLPTEKLLIVAYGRSAVDLAAFVEKQCCNVREQAARLGRAAFEARIDYHAGGYDEAESYERLDATLRAHEGGAPGNRLFFLSVPPTVFGAVTARISGHARAPFGGFTRLMIEKPFGRDSGSFGALDASTAAHFAEAQLFRLDHYLGKEVILNIPSLRWANQLFEPTWNARHIESVQLTFKEDLGTGGRGGYFDGFGIIRDIIQNHLLQAFMWLAMEPPDAMTAAALVRQKVALLKCVRALSLDDAQSVFLGQFGASGDEPGYLDDATVPAGSTCPTFASTVLRVDNDRWRGVPFLFTAGKGMDERVCEVRVRYKEQRTNQMMGAGLQQNELVMRIQPDESIYMITVAKEPGITAEQVRKPAVMDMSYAAQFKGAYVGDAYERMFLNCARGDQALFVSSAELVEAWRIFTPLLHQIDERKPQPVVHPFGVLPAGYAAWAKASGIEIRATWHEYIAQNGSHVEELRKVFDELDVDKSGTLDVSEVTELARRFFDGRQPTAVRVKRIFRELGIEGDSLSFDQLLAGAQSLSRSFQQTQEQVELDVTSCTSRELA